MSHRKPGSRHSIEGAPIILEVLHYSWMLLSTPNFLLYEINLAILDLLCGMDR